jgi:hypothetical protein
MLLCSILNYVGCSIHTPQTLLSAYVCIRLHTFAYVSYSKLHTLIIQRHREAEYMQERERRANMCFEGCGLSMLLLYSMSAAPLFYECCGYRGLVRAADTEV